HCASEVLLNPAAAHAVRLRFTPRTNLGTRRP
ncbi:MAG: hypothetical protein QOG46_153, partial [Pseudonocardiales bacterium]|nr:hypothetical protein [Pseudonocardiales bacterium]